MTQHILFLKISTNVCLLIMCESQENACSDKIFYFHPIIWKTLIKNEILEAIRKNTQQCILCRKDNMRKDLDIGMLWSHEGVLEVIQHIVGPQNASNHL